MNGGYEFRKHGDRFNKFNRLDRSGFEYREITRKRGFHFRTFVSAKNLNLSQKKGYFESETQGGLM